MEGVPPALRWRLTQLVEEWHALAQAHSARSAGASDLFQQLSFDAARMTLMLCAEQLAAVLERCGD